MSDRSNNMFLKKIYCGSDREDFKKDFIVYLKNILSESRWDAMSDHALYLQGGKRAIEEIIAELSEVKL